MFGIDFSEILVIFGIALVVLGPEKLPRLAATIGRWIGRARAMARQFREQLEQEAETLKRNVDLRTHETSPAPAAPAAPATHATATPVTDLAMSITPTNDQPAAPPAEPHERGP